jgi:hypothetical protein
MEQLAQIVFDELQELKKRFDAACKDRKDSLKNLCECCEETDIEIEHPIFGDPILDVEEDGQNVMKLNMAFLCNSCFVKLKEQNKL